MEPQRILVVDDDPSILRLVQLMLTHSGYNVVTASDGDQALALFESTQPDLMVLDLNLPGTPGWEVCKAVKSATHTPVVVITGRSPNEPEVRGVAEQANSYIVKPFDVEVLVDTIRQLMAKS